MRAPSSCHAHRTSPVTQRPPPPAYAILPPAVSNCPGDFCGRPRYTLHTQPRLGILSPPRLASPRGGPGPARAANYRKERGRKRAAAQARPTPYPFRARAASPGHPRRAAPLRSVPGAPATAPGRGGGNPAPRHSRLEGDPHCDRSTPGRRPLPHPPGPRDPTRERQPASGSLPGA